MTLLIPLPVPPGDHLVHVNIDRIDYIEPKSPDSSTVHFGSGETLDVMVPLERIKLLIAEATDPFAE